MKNDTVCWHSGSCQNATATIFRKLKTGKEISVCEEHRDIYSWSDGFLELAGR